MPGPFSRYSHVSNTNYALTDYTEAGGALAMVPGSHQLGRQPTAAERGLDGNERNPNAIPIEVPAGSAIVWHGNTWHGSFPRKQPGLRINLAVYFCRQYLEPQEDYRGYIPEGFIEANGGPGGRMATLLGENLVHGWRDEGMSVENRNKRAAVGRSWQA
jgi:ectoine hydroxylase-related dioxygenase (phytanoyl-CoA dioxygenase family)